MGPTGNVCMYMYLSMKPGLITHAEDTGSDPRVGGKFLFEKVPPAYPSVKRAPGLVLGSKVHWLCLIIH